METDLDLATPDDLRSYVLYLRNENNRQREIIQKLVERLGLPFDDQVALESDGFDEVLS